VILPDRVAAVKRDPAYARGSSRAAALLDRSSAAWMPRQEAAPRITNTGVSADHDAYLASQG